MSDYEALKLLFVKALPQSVVEFLSLMNQCGGSGEKRLKCLAKSPPVVMMALGHGTFSSSELQTLAKSIGAEPSAASDHELADAIFDRMQEGELQAELGEQYAAFEEFMDSVLSQTEPVTILKPDSTDAIVDRVVCYFNPEANFETDWLSLDLSIHPDSEIRSARAMNVRLDNYETGSVSFCEISDFLPQENWIPLYAHKHVELPVFELEEESDGEFPIEFPNEAFKKPYEKLASHSNLMMRISFLYQLAPSPPLGAYAQLGGRLYPWPDESIAEQSGRRVIIRTHANSEPWVEVSLDSKSDFIVLPRIT